MIYDALIYQKSIDSLTKLQKQSETDKEFRTIAFVLEAIQEKYQRDILDVAPLEKNDLEKMDFQRVWIAYPADDNTDLMDSGEWAFVYHGMIYDIESLEGAGFEELINDCMTGENIEQPSGEYQVYKEPHFYKGAQK